MSTPAESPVLIEFRHVSKHYGGDTVIDDLMLAIREGEFFVLVGASGSGKSTTLRMINALAVPDGGDVYYRGRRIKDYNIRALRHRIGYVLQQNALFPNMTVRQNILLMPDILGWKKSAQQARLDELLELVQLPPAQYRNRYPHELSGGEQQRVGILRAIAARPDLLLMDEPFSALDPLTRQNLQDMMRDIHQKLGTTAVFVTHDMAEAVKLGCRIAILRHGKLLQADTPATIRANPADEYVRALFTTTSASAESVLADYARLNATEQQAVRKQISRTWRD